MVYVDDLIITGFRYSFIDDFVKFLNFEFSLKNICDIRERNTMFGAKPISSSAKPGSRLVQFCDPLPDPSLHRSVVDALQYVTITRPEISYVVNNLSVHAYSH